MVITAFNCQDFRNLKNVAIEPSEGTNVIIGENANGKTNLIEAMWILSGARSFRGAKISDMIAFSGDFTRLGVSLKDRERDHKIEVVLSKTANQKRITLNGVKMKYLTSLFGTLKCVVFTPDDLELPKGSPEIRRNFIDLCISQIKPQYAKTKAKYDNILLQRNTLLKNIAIGRSSPTELDVWDIQMAQIGAYISVLRYQYTAKLDRFASGLYAEIAKNKNEDLKISYYSTVYEKLEFRDNLLQEDLRSLASIYSESLEKSRSDDIRLGYTQIGVHRDDVAIEINLLPIRDFGSQGQNRSAALAMKLAQAYILYDETRDMPVILLDDVLSELDRSRKEFVLSKIRDMQVFITACEPVNGLVGKVFRVCNGSVEISKQW